MSEVKTNTQENTKNRHRNSIPGAYLLSSALFLSGITVAAVKENVDSHQERNQAKQTMMHESAAMLRKLVDKNAEGFVINQRVAVAEITLPDNFIETSSIDQTSLLNYGAAVISLPTDLTESTATIINVDIGYNGIIFYPRVSNSTHTGPFGVRLTANSKEVTDDSSVFRAVSNVDLGNTTVEITKGSDVGNGRNYELTFQSTETSIPDDAILIVTQNN